ncbi:MAG TPA: phage head-tail connector protein [Pseudolabrys sp.]|nr:phage head-tail connector protein [Pseudolabrys sp.]
MLEVIAPADSFDLITLADIKAELGITGTTEDANLARWITAASDSVARYCRRVFAAQTYRETFRVAAKPDLVLTRYPVGDVVSVVENETTLAADETEIETDSGVLRRLINDRLAWWACGKIVVTYRAGFADVTDTPSLPAPIERATIMLVSLFRQRAQRDPAVRQVTHGDTAVTYGLGQLGADADALPAEVTALLASYRDFRLR